MTELGARPQAGIYTHSLFGNTASTAWALALDYRLKSGTVEPGDKIVFASAAAGFTIVGRRCRVGGLNGPLPARLPSHQQDVRVTAAASRHVPGPAVAGRVSRRRRCAWTTSSTPATKTQPIDRPIFIIGNPRSGTTFLHRFLLGNRGLAAFELWEMLFPAITARKLLGRIVPRLDRLSPARYHPSDVHDTSLRGIETDDPAWFFHTLDGPFAWAYFLAWQDTYGSELSRRSFGIDGVTPQERERFFHYYEECWRRNLYLQGQRSDPRQDEHAHLPPG